MEEPNVATGDIDNHEEKHPEYLKDSNKKEKSKKKTKYQSNKKELLLNKYEAPPAHCVVQDTSFITTENFSLFVDKKVEEDNISGSSSMVLELPQRNYLDDEDFSTQLSKKLTFKSVNNTPIPEQTEGLQHFSMKATGQFINDKNLHLFVATKPASDNLSLDSDYEGAQPELPERGYLMEDEDIGDTPALPGREYMDDDDVGGILNADRDSVNDYMPLDPATLDRKTALLLTQNDPYINVTKEQREAAEGDYMPLNPNAAGNVNGEENESYMTLRLGQNEDDGSDYTNLTPGNIDLQAAIAAYSVGLKNARDKVE